MEFSVNQWTCLINMLRWYRINVILQMTFPNAFPWIKLLHIHFIEIDFCPTDKTLAVVYVMPWHWTADRSFITWANDDPFHYNDVIMNAMASQITGVSIIYSTICSGADQRKHQSSASLVFVRGIHWWPLNSPHKGPVTRKIFPFDDVIMSLTPMHQRPK